MLAENTLETCYNRGPNRLGAQRMSGTSAQKAFAANLAYWLDAEGRKQTWLAKKLGVDRVAIHRWKTGHSMPPATSEIYDHLADLMGLPSTACLFMEDGVKDPEAALRKLLKDIGADS